MSIVTENTDNTDIAAGTDAETMLLVSALSPARSARGMRSVPSDLRAVDWTTRAACRATDPDALFVQGAAQNRAKMVCSGCPVRTECLADALDNRIEFGVWGGMTERERRALLRRRPDVRSWQQLLQSARREFEGQGARQSGRPSKQQDKGLRATG